MPRAARNPSLQRDPLDPTLAKPAHSAGAWLPWSQVKALCRLRLRPASHGQVFVAVLMTSARYGGREAHLGVGDLAEMTGLAPRTVKAALTGLIGRKLLVRKGRYRRLAVNLGDDAKVDGVVTPSAPPRSRTAAGGADKPAPPRCKQACTSPTSIDVSSFEKKSTDSFSAKQRAFIADVLAEATGLLGSDVNLLAMPDEQAAVLGLASPINYGDAYAELTRTGDRVQARDFTGAVKALRRDKRVQGQDLG